MKSMRRPHNWVALAMGPIETLQAKIPRVFLLQIYFPRLNSEGLTPMTLRNRALKYSVSR